MLRRGFALSCFSQKHTKLFRFFMSARARSEDTRPDSSRDVLPSVFVLCGPSGCGKSTLIGKLMADYPGRFGFSVSHTTRQPREGEINEVHYIFTEKEKMQDEILQGHFLEHALVHGNHYGTSFRSVQSVIGAGKICILDIDVQGVEKVKASKNIDQKTVVYAMLTPPSVEELERRLRGRKTDSEGQIVKRIERAKDELEYARKSDFWDAILVNDTIESCYEKLLDLMEHRFKLRSRHHQSFAGTLGAKNPEEIGR